jgi:hypothetical protein
VITEEERTAALISAILLGSRTVHIPANLVRIAVKTAWEIIVEVKATSGESRKLLEEMTELANARMVANGLAAADQASADGKCNPMKGLAMLVLSRKPGEDLIINGNWNEQPFHSNSPGLNMGAPVELL